MHKKVLVAVEICQTVIRELMALFKDLSGLLA